jgi:hypothetical protein
MKLLPRQRCTGLPKPLNGIMAVIYSAKIKVRLPSYPEPVVPRPFRDGRIL